MKDFLKRELNPQKGKVINEIGEEIGEHDGAVLYTIGERHGFKINKREGDENIRKYYVVAKDVVKNTLVVSDKFDNENLSISAQNLANSVFVRNISFTNSWKDLESANSKEKLSIRIRYRGEKIPVQIRHVKSVNNSLELELWQPDIENLNYAKGQFAVFYLDEKCLGGGELF
jgi:tRNA-specific 2-thiouridylase